MEPETSHEENPTPGGRFERATLFLKQVRDELKRVTWPSRREVRATTVVVLVMTFAMGIYLWGLDPAAGPFHGLDHSTIRNRVVTFVSARSAVDRWSAIGRAA